MTHTSMQHGKSGGHGLSTRGSAAPKLLMRLGRWQGPTSRKEREKWGTQARNGAPKSLIENPLRFSALRLDRDLDQVVIGHPVDQQQQRIDSGLGRRLIRGEPVSCFASSHVHGLAVQDFAETLSL